MSANPMDYIWDEVEAYQKLGEEIYNGIVNAPSVAIREIMEALNEYENSNYPVAKDFMSRSIKNSGDVRFDKSSLVSEVIAASIEFQDIIKDSASSTIGTTIKFRNDANLSRSLHDCNISGQLEVTEGKYTFKGSVEDKYDFRYDWLPKSWTYRGVKLRLAGNIAKACIDVGLMSPFKVSVELDISGEK